MKKIILILLAFLFVLGGCKDNTIDDDKDSPVIDDEAVESVISLIDMIPDEIVESDRQNIIDARANYEALNKDEKALITNIKKLENAESIIKAMDDAAVELVIIFIDMIPDEVVESDRQNILDTRAMYEALNDNEKVRVTNLEKLENAEAIIKAIDDAKAKREQVMANLQLELDNLIPDVVENDMELPTTMESELGEVRVVWYSNDSLTFSNKGKVVPGRKLISVELKTTLIFEDMRHMFTQIVRVKPISFEPLPKSRLSFAYYADYSSSSPFTQEILDSLDVINYAFASVVNGVVSVGYNQKDKILDARRSGVRVTLCIGGYANAAIPFSRAAYTEEGRIKLAKSIVDAVEAYHFDGVDIDWEYPGYYSDPDWVISPTLDKQNYTLFMRELRNQLKAKNPDYILSAAVPAGSTSDRFDIAALNSILDYFHLMTYDMDSSTVSTHHTALYSSGNTIGTWSVKGTVDKYIAAGASKEKLVIGAAFYGREFDLTTTGAIIRANATNRRSITYKDVATYYLSKLGGDVTRYWDNVSKAPYLHNKVTNQVVVYDDQESIKYKAEYAIETGIAGMMFWEYTQDNGDLLKSVYDNLVKGR